MAGSVLTSTVGFLLRVPDVGPISVGLLGGLLGAAWGVLRPPAIARPDPALLRAAPGEPVPVGALGAAAARELEVYTVVALVAGAAIGILSIPLALAAYAAVGARPSLVVVGVAGTLGFVVAIGLVAFLPALLLPARSRAALAAHAWLGARELERGLGSRHGAATLPARSAAVPSWMAAHPETDATRGIHVELHLMSGDLDAADDAIGRIPGDTPGDRFDRALLRAMVDYQRTGAADDGPARAVMEGMPAGIERVEAAVALAAFDARRRLPDGDWRGPMADARRAIEESDLAILVRDFGWVNFVMILRRLWWVALLLVALVLGVGIPIDLQASR